jgi:hypothetical protein
VVVSVSAELGLKNPTLVGPAVYAPFVGICDVAADRVGGCKVTEYTGTSA